MDARTLSPNAAQMLDDLLVEACPAADRAALEAEVDCLIRSYLAGSQEPASLRHAAGTLDQQADHSPGRERLKLWAAVLRRRARA